MLPLAVEPVCRMDRELDGAEPPSGGDCAEPSNPALIGSGHRGGAFGAGPTSHERCDGICLPGAVAGPAPLRERLCRRSGRGPARYPGERFPRLRREFAGMERKFAVGRVGVGGARTAGHRDLQLQRVFCARLMAGSARPQPPYEKPRKTDCCTPERVPAAPGAIPLEARFRPERIPGWPRMAASA